MRGDDHTLIGYAIGWGTTIPQEPYVPEVKAGDWKTILRARSRVEEEQGLHLIDRAGADGRPPPRLLIRFFRARSFRRVVMRYSPWISTRSPAASASSACLVTQTTSGLIIGMLLFLVAVGLTLIFGVLKVVNFSHGAFYMFGAYFRDDGLSVHRELRAGDARGAAGTALLGLIFERVFMSRVYGGDVLMQLLVCYAFVLIFDDVVRMIWGPEFKSMGMPAAFQVMPLFIAGGVVPPYYLLLIGVALAVADRSSGSVLPAPGSAR